MWGNLHNSCQSRLILCSITRSLSRTWGWDPAWQEGGGRPLSELPPGTSFSWPVWPCCIAKSALLNTVASSTYWGQRRREQQKHGKRKMSKALWGIWRQQLHYAGDACCVKCQLASISLLAPAQHVCPDSASSITAMTFFYLSGRHAYLEINVGMACMMLMILKGGGDLPQFHITVWSWRVWKTFVWNGKWTREGGGSGNTSLLSQASQKQLKGRVVQ